MRFLKKAGFAALIVLMGAPAYAQIERHKSIFTVTEPVEVSGTVLQPGTYLIKVVEDKSERSIVKISNEDQTQVFATALATPRPITEGDMTEVSRFIYFPSTPGQPKALRTWIPAHVTLGQDFVYPSGRATELAAAAHAPVISIPEGTTETQFQTITTTPVEPPEVKAEAPAPPPPPAPEMVAESRVPETLPTTGSAVPLAALAGLLFVVAAVAVRLFVR